MPVKMNQMGDAIVIHSQILVALYDKVSFLLSCHSSHGTESSSPLSLRSQADGAFTVCHCMF